MTVPHRLTTYTPKAVALGVASALVLSLTSPFVDLASADTAPNTDHSARVTTSEVASTLRRTSGVLQDSSAVKGTSDGDTALKTDDDGDGVRIHKHARDGVRLASKDGDSLDITLPGADQSGDGQQIAPGVVAYSSNNGSANAVQAQTDGSVRMLTVIDNSSAPTTYDYKVSVPEGGWIELQDDGSAQIMGEDEVVIATVAIPWATDAKGKQIKTWFTTDGETLVQHTKHRVRGIAYPVTADPSISLGWNVYVNFNKSETDSIYKFQEAGTYGAPMVASVCLKVPSPYAQAACGVLLTVKAGQFGWAIRNAHEANSCLQIVIPYAASSSPALIPTLAWFGWAKC